MTAHELAHTMRQANFISKLQQRRKPLSLSVHKYDLAPIISFPQNWLTLQLTSEMRGWHQHFVQPFFQTNGIVAMQSGKNTKPHTSNDLHACAVGRWSWCMRVHHTLSSSLQSMPALWVDKILFDDETDLHRSSRMCVVPLFSHCFPGFRLYTWLREGRPIRSLIDMIILLKRKARRGVGF
jgi:hypothetical protein